MESRLVKKIRTVDEADRFVEEIDLLINSLYTKNKDDFDQILKSKIRHWTSEIIREELSKSEKDKVEILEDIKKKIKGYKVFHMSLAFEPTGESIERIFDFLRKNHRERVLLKLDYIPELMGGAVVIFDGKYRDFTLKKVMEEKLKVSMDHVMRMLNK